MLNPQEIISKMIKLALIGKNIQHSRSPQIYKELIKHKIQYDLLDYENHLLIPSAKKLLQEYAGVSITSPYKKHFLNEVILTPNAKILGAINCLSIKNGEVVGENTDFLAVVDILKKWIDKYRNLNVIVLGDGVMSKVTQYALSNLNISFKVYSRKKNEFFNQLNLPNEFSMNFNDEHQNLVINTCAREYVFDGVLNNQIIFWDYNYQFAPHLSKIPNLCQQYIDGLEMLELQAQYALSFWSTSNPSFKQLKS